MTRTGCMLTVDIHGGSIGITAFVPMQRADQKIEIIYSDVHSLSLSTVTNDEARIHVIGRAVSEATKKAFETITKSYGKTHAIEDVSVVYAPIWSSVKAIEISVQRDQPFLVTERFISSLTSKDRANLSTKEYRVVKTTYESLKLNGYESENPLGKVTNQISGEVHIVLVNRLLSETVLHAINKTLGHIICIEHSLSELLSRHTFTLSGVGERYIGYVFVDDDITSIGIVRDGFIKAEQSFPAGIHKLHSDLFPNMDTAITMSLSKLAMDSLGDPVWRPEIKTRIDQHIDEWKKEFTKALSSLRINSPIPHHFVVYASEGSSFIAKLLDGEQAVAYAGAHVETIELTKIDTPYTNAIKVGGTTSPISVIESLVLIQ